MRLSKLLESSSGWVIAIVGLQWGDEGKGKFVDFFAEHADIVARGTGGANAGHTIVINGISYVFHLVPSAILRDKDGLVNVIGRGVALDPTVMLSELAELDELGVSYGNLRISRDAHLVLPQHIVLDRASEAAAGDGKIGTTGRGIGPLYTDHTARHGLSVVDMLNPKQLREKLLRNKNYHIHELMKPGAIQVMEEDQYLGQFLNESGNFDIDKVVEVYVEYGKRLRPYITNTDLLLQEAVASGKKVLLEGAQATLLSIVHGLTPMVTPSDSTINGLVSGVGIQGSQVDMVLGIVKAPWLSKVGGGNMPTEISTQEHDATAAKTADINSNNPDEQCLAIRRTGKEFGATTGRARRIGWLDLPLLRHALRSGGDELILTKVDVLDKCAKIPICTHYIYQGEGYDLGDRILKNGEQVNIAFGDDTLMKDMEPVYKVFPGWMESTKEVRSCGELPLKLQTIIDFIEEQAGKPIAIVSVGPQRDQTASK